MGENVALGRGVLRRARTYVSGRPTTQKAGAGVAAALLASAPFGGLAAVPEPPPGTLRLGQPIQVGPYEMVIDQVVELPDLAPAVTPQPSERVLVLDAHVTLTGDRPEYAVTLTNHVTVAGGGVEVEGRPSLYFVEDSSRMSGFNPGLTYRLALTFTTSGPWQGDVVTVRTNLVEFREEDRQTLDPDAWVGRDEVEWQGSLPLVRRT
ncbi:hypothetical protein [Knoellia aerolata]|uniref:Uncharacterized protein n=1 Tax=Knoellia aerolata DSM 18566 TaxID=1385519 RepID=A0A0A0K053_9MICO|nr:hypothetical protein [Knoellia aerolata]KGN41717.1 hypothetical protein N801_06075 [Knoellia aerolata DSM 18566]